MNLDAFADSSRPVDSSVGRRKFPSGCDSDEECEPAADYDKGFMMNSEKLLRFVAYASISTLLLVAVLVYRRFRPSAANVPYARHAAAALALSLGVPTVLSGLAHSLAVASLALDGSEQYGPLTILRFTTGAMLFYSGAMSIGLCRAIRAGRRRAIGVSAATCLFFCVYLLFLFPLPGTGGTVPPMLGLWSVYLPVLGAAALTTGLAR